MVAEVYQVLQKMSSKVRNFELVVKASRSEGGQIRGDGRGEGFCAPAKNERDVFACYKRYTCNFLIKPLVEVLYSRVVV